MIRIAIVEDNRECAAKLASYIRRYEQEKHAAFSVDSFSDGLQFISDYKGDYDMVFLDIVMPHMDGLEAAKQLREMDQTVCLIFITSMAHLAIRGYEFRALDFLVKPVEYPLFAAKLERAVGSLTKDEIYGIRVPNGMKRVRVSEIVYIESNKHYLHFHTKEGEYRMRGSMREIREYFEQNQFASAGNSILVNLSYVEEMSGNTVSVNGEKLSVVQKYKAEFWDRLTQYIGEL